MTKLVTIVVRVMATVAMTMMPMMLRYTTVKMLCASLVGVLLRTPNCLVVFDPSPTHMRKDRQIDHHNAVSNAIPYAAIFPQVPPHSLLTA